MITGDAHINAGAPVVCCNGRDPGEPGAARGRGRRRGVRSYGRVPFLRRLRPRLGVAGAVAHAAEGAVLAHERHAGRRVVHCGRRFRGARAQTWTSSPTRRARCRLPTSTWKCRSMARWNWRCARARRRFTWCISRRTRRLPRRRRSRATAWRRRKQREQVKEAVKGTRFTTAFGKTLKRLLASGVGVHHAGMLPRYRLLVEKLAQQGLLPVICGTDTLGRGHQRAHPHRGAHRAHEVRRAARCGACAPASSTRSSGGRGRFRLRHRGHGGGPCARARHREREAGGQGRGDPKKLRKIKKKQPPRASSRGTGRPSSV